MKAIVVVVISLISFFASSEEENPKMSVKSKLEICTEHSNVARKIMEIRQSGGGHNDIFAIFQSNAVIDPLVISAYSTPVMNSDEWRKFTINKFSDKAMVDCVKLLSSM